MERIVVTEDLRHLPPPPSEKLVADVAESASALTLQEPGVSSSEVSIDAKSREESFTTTPPAAPHNTIGSSSSTLLSNCEKLLIDVADSASKQALKEPGVSWYELIGRSSEESIIASPPHMLPYNTIDVSSSCENIVAGAGDSICAPALQYPDVSSSDEFSDNSSEESISSPRTVPHNTTDGSLQSASSLGSSILVQSYVNCYQDFYIRMDRRGLFLTYPDVGGPFHSKDEAIHATKCFFDELWRERCKDDDEFSHVEGVVHDHKYYHRGPPERTISQSTYDGKRYLIKAILDQLNDDNNLVGNRAHELDDLLRKQIIYEKNTWYYHFNFTTKQKEYDDNSSNAKKLFFAEVVDVPERKCWEVICCCMIDPQPDGVPSLHDDDVVCYGCTNNGSPSMMHPSDTGAYTAGRWNGYLPFSYDSGSDDDENVIDMRDVDDDDDDEDEEEEEELKEALREMLKAWPKPIYVQPAGGP